MFRSTNETAAFTSVAVVTNATRYLDTDTLPGLTNRYFVKRGALSGTFARTLETNEYASIALPAADNYAIPYRRVWAVNCGYTGADATYGEFAPDTQFSGTGSQGYATENALTLPDTLDFPAPTNVYKTVRYNPVATNGVAYAFPVLTNRYYRLRLHFCEAWSPERTFNISVNGSSVASNYSITNAAGGMNRATILECDCAPDTNSLVRVSFSQGSASLPVVNGIELVEFYYASPLAAGELPVTVSNTWEAVAEVRSRVSNTAAYSGTVWRAEAPDGVYTALGSVPFNGGAWGDTPGTGLATNKSYRYVVRADGVAPEASVAGTLVSRFIPNRYSVWMGSSSLLHFVPPTGFLVTNSTPWNVSSVIDRSTVSGAGPLEMYQQQRFNRTLAFAFTNLHALASYRLRLHAAETLYSTLGGRCVNIAVNGQTVYANFDAATFAGASYRAAAPEFAVQANSQGTLAVTLVWANQNPLLAALEVRAVPLAAAPAGLTADRGSAKVTLSWQPVAGADGYAVYRTAAGGEPQEIGRVAGTTFTDTTGVVGTTYTYAVRAYNEFGDGPSATAAAIRYPAIKGTLIRIF